MSLLLGVDIGTSSCEEVLTTPDGAVVATAVREHVVSRPHPGWAEHDARTVWWDGRPVRHEPKVWARARRLFMASSFLVHELTGEYVADLQVVIDSAVMRAE
jgi:sugar (pentulose or hexulose) kinase